MATIQTTPEKESKIENSHKISICDITKNNTSEILQKIEGLAAIYLQGYSDLFIKYIHSFNTAFGTCRISEKQFFDTFGIDHTIMAETANNMDFVKNLYLIQIETFSRFIQDSIDFRISTIDSIEKSMNSAFDHYSKAISEINKK